ncbi:MAG: preprotein translocase subunit SecD, partial [Nanoarchaeota archaeon]|nr:preprotein translocase subunit SecD [Nanoarchaeota archaeon]
SPVLGQEFIHSILIAAVSAIVVVSLVIFVRYRRIKASLALLLTSFSELIIILGVAAMIRWNLDLPSIAGILATIGTGVDQQIIILDEAGRSKQLSIKERIKRASGIILSAYLTLVAAMIPLYWAGAGLFKGFALTTIIGVTAGVLITRPAFAEMIRRVEG